MNTDEKWKSGLGPKDQRFLSQALSRARDPGLGVLNNDRLMEEFSARDIMFGFKDAPNRRADILGSCVGMKRNTAVKKSVEEAARDLDLALESGDTNPDEVCALIPSDDLVRYHDPARIWSLLFKDRWPDRKSPEHQRFMAYLLEQVLALALLGTNTAREMVQVIGIEEFDKVPSSLRVKVLRLAIDMGEGQTASGKSEPFRAQHLLAALPPTELVEHLELTVLERVLRAVALRYKWVAAEPATPPAIAAAAQQPSFVPAPPPPATATAPLAPPAPPPPPPPPPPPAASATDSSTGVSPSQAPKYSVDSEEIGANDDNAEPIALAAPRSRSFPAPPPLPSAVAAVIAAAAPSEDESTVEVPIQPDPPSGGGFPIPLAPRTSPLRSPLPAPIPGGSRGGDGDR